MRRAARLILALATAAAACAARAQDAPAPVPASPAMPPASAPASGPADAADGTTVTVTAPLPAPRPVVIDAPGVLKDLLVANLDLSRAARLTGDAALDDGEWARLVAAAPAQVRELVATEGYFDPVVDIEVARDGSRTIRVRVTPGPRARIGRVTLQYDGDLDRAASDGDAAARATEEELRQAWPLATGADFRNATWSDAKAQWLARLRARGYGAAVWEGTSATLDPATHEMRLFLVADSGPLFKAGPVVIEGLERQPEPTVRRLAGFGEGAPLDEARLLDYQDRLQKTGLFDQVAVSYDPDPAQAAHATVSVHVHEQRLQQTAASVGVSANTGPRVSVEYVNRQPFGQPLTADSKLVWGRDEQSATLDLVTHPNEHFNSWLTGFAYDRLVTSNDVTKSSDLTKTWHARFGRTRDTTRFERLQFVQVERSLQCSTLGCVDGRAVSLNQNTTWRRVDSIVLPTDGWTLSTQTGVGIAGGPGFNYGPFARLYGRYTRYWPLPSQWYASGRIELGQVFAGGGVNLPQSELFRAGGDESVRGYDYLSLAPVGTDGVIGGRALLTLSGEIAHPISAKLPTVWGAVFVDAGNAANHFSDMTPSGGDPATRRPLKLGPGLGLRWRSPVGPLKVDWAFDDRGRGHLSLSIGIAF